MLQVDIARQVGDLRIDAAFSAPSAGIVALFGRSGAGKTSIVNMLAGLLRPDRGRIAINGTTVFDSEAGVDLPPERRRLGYIFQEDRLFPHLDVRRNLLYGFRRARGGAGEIRFDRIVAMLGIEALLDRRTAALSGGEKQRVAIGRALLAGPRLLLMDEPLASLDGARKEEILPFIAQLPGELGLPIVYVTHDVSEIVRLADSVVLLSDGRVAAEGAVDEIMGRLDLRPLTGRYEAGAVLSGRVAAHDTTFGLTEIEVPGGRLRVARLDLAIGAAVRVRVRARDVAVALVVPKSLSILNVLSGVIAEIGEGDGPFVDLRIDTGAPLWARITARSAHELGLRTGQPVHALIKTVAIDRHSLGLAPRDRAGADRGD